MYMTQMHPTPTPSRSSRIGLEGILNPAGDESTRPPFHIQLPPLTIPSQPSPPHPVLPAFSSFDERAQGTLYALSPVSPHPESESSRPRSSSSLFFSDGRTRSTPWALRRDSDDARGERGTYEARARDEYRRRTSGDAARPDSPSAAYGPASQPALATRHALSTYPPPPLPLSASPLSDAHRPRVLTSSPITDGIAFHRPSSAGAAHSRFVHADETGSYGHHHRAPYPAYAYQPPPPASTSHLPGNSGSYVHPQVTPTEHSHSHAHRPLYSYHHPRSYQYSSSFPSHYLPEGSSEDDLQSAERVSTRLVAKRTNASHVLHLTPTSDSHRKRTYSDVQYSVDADAWQAGHTHSSRASPSSLSSLSTPSPEEDGLHAPKPAKRARAKSDVAGSEYALGGQSQTSKKRGGSEEGQASGSKRSGSSKRGKGKATTPPTARAIAAARNVETIYPSAAAQQTWGVCVVPVHAFNPNASQAAPVPILIPTAPVPNTVELQYARCMSARYKSDPFPRCVSCTRRWAGDTCRFQNIRMLGRDANKNLVTTGFQGLNAKVENTVMHYPKTWNIPLEKQHIERTMRTVAAALLPHLRKEQLHQQNPKVARRQRESDVRATCDTCMTSLFSNTWMCINCGREACEECFGIISRITSAAATSQPQSATSPTSQRTPKERLALSNPFFLSCARKSDHGVQTFTPVTRFVKAELNAAVAEMEMLTIAEHGTDSQLGSASSSKDSSRADTDSQMDHGVGDDIQPEFDERIYDDGICSLIRDPTPPRYSDEPMHVDLIPTHPIPRYTTDALSEEVFTKQWAQGIPIVVSGVSDRFQVQWTPEYFMSKYGGQPCIILECQTDANKKVTVGEFFSSFGRYEDRTECWKLKDWPPSSDFKTAFPELYEDFDCAVPVPNYCRRDGAMNIASHFPTNTVSPDLGPKMYNAYAAQDGPGGKGSTRLHMDMADAVNMMVHAEATAAGDPGCAAWDIFRAEDAAKIRHFLKRRFKGQVTSDPIHAQSFFLDSELRRELFEQHGVKSFRVYQRPGDAVFIPAGCAHQVCNYADCIKVAVDFVSPENIERCETLTREFREQNQNQMWKEDVLQLKAMMWFAWLSCRQQQQKLAETTRVESICGEGGSRMELVESKHEEMDQPLTTDDYAQPPL